MLFSKITTSSVEFEHIFSNPVIYVLYKTNKNSILVSQCKLLRNINKTVSSEKRRFLQKKYVILTSASLKR
jgi:stage III sporulation protein SpoIIIAA